MRRLLLVFLLVAACAEAEPLSPATPEGHTVTGRLEAPECGGGYDIVNASVTLRDGEGTIVGTATTYLIEKHRGFAGMIELCVVGFKIDAVPERDFYELTIGTHGGPSYSLGELQASDWDIQLTL
jgi:hypothetical protein